MTTATHAAPGAGSSVSNPQAMATEAAAGFPVEPPIDSADQKISPALLSRFAIHEAAHAVTRLYLGMGTIAKITIDAPQGGGYIVWRTEELPDQTEEYLLAVLASTLAGRAAEEELLGSVAASAGGPRSSDLGLATEMALEMETTLGFGRKWPLLHRPAADRAQIFALDHELAARVNARLEVTYGAARKIVGRQKTAIEFLASLLLVHRTLEGPELEHLLDEVRERIVE